MKRPETTSPYTNPNPRPGGVHPLWRPGCCDSGRLRMSSVVENLCGPICFFVDVNLLASCFLLLLSDPKPGVMVLSGTKSSGSCLTRFIEIDVGKGVLPGALVKAKLLKQPIATDVDVHISVGGQTHYCISENETVIEIMGECRHVQKALSHVSSKLRENLLPRKDLEEMRARVGSPYENGGASYNLQPSQQASHGGLTNPQNASRGDSLSVSNGEQDLKMVRSGTEVMKSIYQLMHTEIVNEVNGFTPPTVLENGLRTQD
ncbi:hypothetical protein Bca52824_002147 [Brassica carinata]|uniref:Uncharacterized protein n=1 Tax=Brassica carinata TaxID=52824 RepID=A0A8X8BDP9_BRACI|nr:hypothetical protein Bca52824_002147 [Brassica carinata]